MSDERCLHDLLPGQCGPCTGRDGGYTAERKRRADLLRLPGVVAARFAGFCLGCGDRFAAGEPIATPRGLTPPAWRGPCCLSDAGLPVR